MSALENPFDAPVPGQSLTDTPGNSPWEHPPQFAKVDEAAEYIWDRLHSEEMWSPDVALLLSEIILKQIMAIGIKAEIPKMKIFITDQSNNKFHQEFAKFKVQNKTTSSVGEEKKEKFLEEIKQELESKKPSGIMTKETE